METGERRKWRRLAHGLRVELRVLGPNPGRAISAIGTHLSPEGLFVLVADPPSAGTRVRVTIGGDDAESVQLSAEGVVVNQSQPTDAHDETGVGIALADAGPAWRKLYEWLSQAT